MRSVVVTPKGVELVEVAEPAIAPGEVLVEMTVAGICGSDTHAAAGEHPFVPLPYHPGHEVVGIVRGLAAGVENVAVGDHVIIEPPLPCWNCKMCRTGRSNICENLRFFGTVYEQGGLADRFTIPARRVHVLPPDISDVQGVLIEPLATPLHAVRLAGGVDGKAVVILGCGAIGLLTLKAVRHSGARKVVMTDPRADKRALALELSADAVFDSTRPDLLAAVRAELGESADVVFDCVSFQSTVDQAVALASKGGIVMTIGVPVKAVTVDLPTLQDHQIRLQGSATYMAEDYEVAATMISAGEVAPEDFVTASFPLDEAAEAFATARAGAAVKVVVTAQGKS